MYTINAIGCPESIEKRGLGPHRPALSLLTFRCNGDSRAHERSSRSEAGQAPASCLKVWAPNQIYGCMPAIDRSDRPPHNPTDGLTDANAATVHPINNPHRPRKPNPPRSATRIGYCSCSCFSPRPAEAMSRGHSHHHHHHHHGGGGGSGVQHTTGAILLGAAAAAAAGA